MTSSEGCVCLMNGIVQINVAFMHSAKYYFFLPDELLAQVDDSVLSKLICDVFLQTPSQVTCQLSRYVQHQTPNQVTCQLTQQVCIAPDSKSSYVLAQQVCIAICWSHCEKLHDTCYLLEWQESRSNCTVETLKTYHLVFVMNLECTRPQWDCNSLELNCILLCDVTNCRMCRMQLFPFLGQHCYPP